MANKTEEVSIIQEVTDEETTTQEVVEKEPILETTPLPENVDKLVTFMQETGGNIPIAPQTGIERGGHVPIIGRYIHNQINIY